MTKAKGEISFHFITAAPLKNRRKLKAFLIDLSSREGKKIDAINYIFCPDEYLLGINREYLKHDTYTDIITFELSAKGEPVISDIYISIDRVRENAKSFKVSFEKELHRVIFHGMLHLCGYKDKRKNDAAEMRKREEACLMEYFKA